MKNWDYTSGNCHEKQDADNVSVTKASEHEEKILLKTNAKVGARTKQNEVLMTSASREIEERSAEYKNENSREKRQNFSQYGCMLIRGQTFTVSDLWLSLQATVRGTLSKILNRCTDFTTEKT